MLFTDRLYDATLDYFHDLEFYISAGEEKLRRLDQEIVPALERGLAVGGATGLLAGIVAVSFPPAGLVLGGGAILGLSLAGAGVGAWVSSMIGADVPNSQLKEFQAAIDAGQLLFIIDVPKTRVEELSELIKKHHPEAEIEGTEPTVPAFP